ncbi:NAD(+) diphosphatase [Pseudarthrobacter sp. NamE2]|uniref:NAD(+) diphosphatase n=1 Tax=Pseudarthrobacter sp. NamE2 TaxID=2576838 RepID=UPI0010FE373C|nr:NAD(+) diphosphatase [Pseudarthrobacter sp. NamE2]TLM85603.1 NAD(+) diphosphatase [Pseudarthrobacter sp. NamE2]
MSHAESVTPAHQGAPALLPANHLQETLLPVPPALVDRGSAARMRQGMVEELLAAPGTQAVVLSGRQGLVQNGALFLAGAKEFREALAAASVVPDLVIYLGSALPAADLPAGTELLLFILSEPVQPGTAGIPANAAWAGFRDVAAGLGSTGTALFIEASAIANWHSGHTHCPRCGTPTLVESGGWMRRCPVDSSEHYPRTDPAIIVTVVGADGRLLLGGGGPADARNYSTLAGFVEPGESLEQAVVREVFEEVGVRVTACQYLGSQSWPFPASLMLGFTAVTEDAVATPDGVEVTRARWFSREELQEAVLRGDVTISTRLSIARALIEHWYGGRIEDLAGA